MLAPLGLYPLSLKTVLCVVVALLIVAIFVRRGSRSTQLPPGPPGDPLLGHARFIPSTYAWKTFAEWGKKYGDVVYVHVLGRPMVVVNTFEAAKDLMDKRGANYSDRPRYVLFAEMMGWGDMTFFLTYGERFRRQRTFIQQHFNHKAVGAYRRTQQKGLYKFLDNLLQTPENFLRHIHRAVSSSLVMAIYGHEVVNDEDKFIRLVEKVTRMLNDGGSPGGILVDFLPMLRHLPTWFPGAGFKRHALEARKHLLEMVNLPYETIRFDRATGTAKPSFVCSLMDKYDCESPEVELDIKSAGGGMYGAGVETSEGVLATFFLMMARFPEYACRAQQEIDRVIGQERVPSLDDRAQLPYVDCIMKETFRWNPPVPLSLPHASMEEDMYNGYTIPARSMIIPNIWQMMRDERYFANPDRFDPERFLGKQHGEGVVFTDAQDPSVIVFGFGRRMCPGRYYAEASLWMTIAAVLSLFDILPPLDPRTGEEVVPPDEFTSGATSQPKPFKCRILPRSKRTAHLVQHGLAQF